MPASAFPLADADLCVKCALCLPHCPTYRLSLNEGDSPRGRIALMQALATGGIPASDAVRTHLDGCLTCRACEAVCPADVPYGRLIDAGRAVLAERVGTGGLTRLIAAVLTRPWLRRSLARALWLFQASGLRKLLRGALRGRGTLSRLESLLPPALWPQAPRAHSAAAGSSLGSVQLFTSCSAELGEAEVLRDATILLTRLGYSVTVPAGQACCGALHQHNGMPTRAAALARRNTAAFVGGDPIISTVTGCTAMLSEYTELLAGGAAAGIAQRVQDVCGFLDGAPGWERLNFRPLTQTVAVHEPCSLRNVLGRSGAAYSLLRRIPGLRVLSLPGNPACCGAAGSYFLTETETADRLATAKLDAITGSGADIVVTTNIGCALHIAGALRRAGRAVPLRHPVSLLAGQLEPLPPAH